MENADLPNGSKGVPWERLFRVLAVSKAHAPLLLQTFHLNGKKGPIITFQVKGTDSFAGLSPAKRVRSSPRFNQGWTQFPALTFLSPESDSHVAFDYIVTGSKNGSISTKLLSMKVTASYKAMDEKKQVSEKVFGLPANITYNSLKLGGGNDEGKTLQQANKNLATVWREISTGDSTAVTGPKQGVDFVVISPRRYADITWATDQSDEFGDGLLVIPLDNMRAIVPEDVSRSFTFSK
jgi:hypothetical protein